MGPVIEQGIVIWKVLSSSQVKELSLRHCTTQGILYLIQKIKKNLKLGAASLQQ